jgi:hypothetical protein
MAELYGNTEKLLLCQAVCLERMGKFDEARALFDKHSVLVTAITYTILLTAGVGHY